MLFAVNATRNDVIKIAAVGVARLRQSRRLAAEIDRSFQPTVCTIAILYEYCFDPHRSELLREDEKVNLFVDLGAITSHEVRLLIHAPVDAQIQRLEPLAVRPDHLAQLCYFKYEVQSLLPLLITTFPAFIPIRCLI